MIYETKEVLVDGKVPFEVPVHFELVRKVGSGAYGTVASFKDTRTGEVGHSEYYISLPLFFRSSR